MGGRGVETQESPNTVSRLSLNMSGLSPVEILEILFSTSPF